MPNKERLNVIKCKEGGYSAHLVNLPIVVEGDSIEEVKARAKELAVHWVNRIESILTSDDPFDVKEFDETSMPNKPDNNMEQEKKLELLAMKVFPMNEPFGKAYTGIDLVNAKRSAWVAGRKASSVEVGEVANIIEWYEENYTAMGEIRVNNVTRNECNSYQQIAIEYLNSLNTL